MSHPSILVRGARVHNLKNIEFEIPHNALTVVTGVSGSGKSSLAFDTIYAEGQRRYIESLSAYARQFLERIEKPDADEILGIAPAIAIRQKNSTRNPRSTVATATEIYDYLRLLFARVGRTWCGRCGEEVRRDSVDEVAGRVLALPTGAGAGQGWRCYVLFPVQRAGEMLEPEALKARLFDLRKRGFSRLFQLQPAQSAGCDEPARRAGQPARAPVSLAPASAPALVGQGRTFEFSAPESLLDLNFSEPIFVLADRLVLGPDLGPRIIDTVETCYREGGEAVFQFEDACLRFNERFECKGCGQAAQEPEPQLFSFNSPVGACPRCQGFGNTIDFDLDLVVPDKSKSLDRGAIDPWTKPKYRHFYAELRRAARWLPLRLDLPFGELSAEERQALIEGRGRFPGIKGFFEYLERKKYKLHVRVFLSRYRGYTLCPSCQGARLRREALQVRVAGKNIGEVCRLTIEEARSFFSSVELSPMQGEIAARVLEEIRQRLEFLHNVGLEYLTLDRLASTLSGGEAQRIQLATSLGSRLVGALYVLDEPSIGLHGRDTGRLIRILHELRNLGNTILVVEHDAEMMSCSDRILDLGPGAGENGGRVVFAGSYDQLVSNGSSLTGRYLKGELRIPVPELRRAVRPKNQLRIVGARIHNLKDLDVTIPLGMMVAVSGVSGSGKSTLVHEVIYQGLKALGQRESAPGPLLDEESFASKLHCRRMEGAHLVRDVVLVDQSPIGRTPRSNPVTYIKAFDAIRELFAATPDAARRGYTSGYFSFNIPGGRCEACQGEGTVTVEMQFLADVELVCEECKGTRFKSGVLEVRYRGKNIHEVLQMTVREALGFFAAVPKIVNRLRVLDEVGLGYLRLGQSATTLSGGEAQRVKLSAHLAQHKSEKTLYIFDEPTTGLHFDDISKLLAAFHKLLEEGAGILIIEHNLDVIKTSDWVIDLGPEGGERGGRVVVAGTPETVARTPGSYTGQYLARVLGSSDGGRVAAGSRWR